VSSKGEMLYDTLPIDTIDIEEPLLPPSRNHFLDISFPSPTSYLPL
jgi:hypothetical protein